MSSRTRHKRIRSRLKPDERISKILAATRRLLSEKGYENLVTSEIADCCGISEATIYKYFATKRDLLTRVAEQWFAELIDVPKVAAPQQGIHERLRQLIWESLSVVRRDPSISRYILMELRADPGYRSMYIYELNRQFTGKILSVLEEAIASGEFQTDVPARLLRNMIFGSIEHQTWAYLRGEGDFDAERAADGIANVIYRGMVRSPSQSVSASRNRSAEIERTRAAALPIRQASRKSTNRASAKTSAAARTKRTG